AAGSVTGANLPSGVRIQMAWSSAFTNQTKPACTVKAPPPYSCTLLRTDKGVSRQDTQPLSVKVITVTRPASEGQDSSQYRCEPSLAARSTFRSLNLRPAEATCAAVMVEGQLQ